MATVIKNGLVYDGLGGKPKMADVLIRENVIAGVGSFSRRSSYRVIDASGALIVPGFIDSASEAEWFGNPGVGYHAERSLEYGITSLIIGASGESIVPATSKTVDAIAGRSYPEVNYHWGSVPEFINSRIRRAVNVGLVVGAISLHKLISFGVPRDLTHRELRVAVRILKTAFDAGSFGVSIDCSGNTLIAPEIDAIIDTAAHARRAVVFVTHSNKDHRFRDALQYANERKVRALVRIPWATRNPHEHPVLSEENLRKNISIGVCPTGSRTVSIGDILSNLVHGSGEPHDGFVRELKERLVPYESMGLVISHPGRPELSFLAGIPVAGFAERRGVDFSKAMILLNSLSSGRMKFSVSHTAEAWENLAVSKGSIAEWGIPDPLKNPSMFLRSVSLKNPDLLPLAVQNLTSAPANFFGFNRRGFIGEGAFADLSILRDWNVETVFVNGIQASHDNVDRAGVILKSKFS